MKAPPRSTVAPAAFTCLAIPMSISRPSTAQGPAMTCRRLPPSMTPPVPITLGSGLNSRETILYGFWIGMTWSTPGRISSGTSRSAASSPMAPMMVRSTPRERCGVQPAAWIFSMTWSISAWVAPGLRTMIMAAPFRWWV